MRKLGKWLFIALVLAIGAVFIADGFGGADERNAQMEADNEASRQGTISGEPFSVEAAEEPEGMRLYPDYEGQFAVPAYGVLADLLPTDTPEEEWQRDHATNWGTADIVRGGTSTPTSEEGTVVIHINIREALDAVGNPLVDRETKEAVTEPGDLFILDGVPYELRETTRVSVADLAPGTEPVVLEDGRALVFAFFIEENGAPTGEAVVFTLHRIVAD